MSFSTSKLLTILYTLRVNQSSTLWTWRYALLRLHYFQDITLKIYVIYSSYYRDNSKSFIQTSFHVDQGYYYVSNNFHIFSKILYLNQNLVISKSTISFSFTKDFIIYFVLYFSQFFFMPQVSRHTYFYHFK